MRRRIGNRMVRSRCQMKRMSFMAQLATCLIRRFAQTFVIGLRKPSVEGGL